MEAATPHPRYRGAPDTGHKSTGDPRDGGLCCTRGSGSSGHGAPALPGGGFRPRCRAAAGPIGINGVVLGWVPVRPTRKGLGHFEVRVQQTEENTRGLDTGCVGKTVFAKGHSKLGTGLSAYRTARSCSLAAVAEPGFLLRHDKKLDSARITNHRLLVYTKPGCLCIRTAIMVIPSPPATAACPVCGQTTRHLYSHQA